MIYLLMHQSYLSPPIRFQVTRSTSACDYPNDLPQRVINTEIFLSRDQIQISRLVSMSIVTQRELESIN